MRGGKYTDVSAVAFRGYYMTLITVIRNEVYSFNRAVETVIICCHNSTHPSIYPSIRLFVSYTAGNVLHYVLHLIHCHAYISCYS